MRMMSVMVCGADKMIQQNTVSENFHTTVIDHCRNGHDREHNEKCNVVKWNQQDDQGEKAELEKRLERVKGK